MPSANRPLTICKNTHGKQTPNLKRQALHHADSEVEDFAYLFTLGIYLTPFRRDKVIERPVGQKINMLSSITRHPHLCKV